MHVLESEECDDPYPQKNTHVHMHVAFYVKFLDIPGFVGRQLTCGLTTIHMEILWRHLKT